MNKANSKKEEEEEKIKDKSSEMPTPKWRLSE